jgi:phospholipid/cholesterol/gamma-HCH transport system substrate-binding protein
VKSINFSPEGTGKSIIVDMEINSESFARVKKDSNARLGSQGLLGDRTIDLTVGSPELPSIGEGEYVNSTEPAQLDDLISKSGDALTNIEITAQNAKEISWKINHGDGSLAKIINDPRLYTNLDSLLNLWSDIMTKINSGQGNLAKVVNDSSFYNNLSGSLGEIRTFLATANSGQGTLGKLMKEDSLYHHVDSLLSSIDSTLIKINHGEGTAGKLINNDDLYNKMNDTIDDLDKLIADIKANPKKYLKISIF